MNTTFRFVCAVVMIASLSAISHAQRQQALYIDNGSGVFTKITATGAGGTLNLPSSGTVASTNTVWSLTGNSGTTPGTDFIGTTDNVNLEFKVNGGIAGLIGNANSNTGLGIGVFQSTTGTSNTLIGKYAGVSLTSANFNTAIGSNALYTVTDNTSNSNTAVGYLAMQLAANGSANNTALGTGALANAGTYTHCTALGDNANVTGGGSYTDATAIGYNAAATASYTMQLGDASVTQVNTQTAYAINGTNVITSTALGSGISVAPANLQNNGTTPSSTTFYEGDGKWATPSGGSSSPLLSCFSSNTEYAATEYHTIFGSGNDERNTSYTTAAQAGVPIPAACTIDEMYLYGDNNYVGGNANVTFTLYKNGVATSMTTTISLLSTDGLGTLYTAEDNTHTVSISAGDVVSLQQTYSGSFTSPYGAGATLHCALHAH
jgi:hypothetical protein